MPAERSLHRSRSLATPSLATTSIHATVGRVFAAAMILLVILVSTTSPSEVSLYSSLFLWANIALFASTILDPRSGAISFAYQFFFLMFIALPTWVQVDARIFPFASIYTNAQLAPAFAALSFFQLSYLLGRQSVPPTKSRLPTTPTLEAPRTGWAWPLLFALAATMVIVGPSALFSPRFSIGASESDSLSAQLLLIGRSISLFLVLALSLNWKLRVHRPLRRSSVYQLFAAWIVFMILNFPPALPRFQLLGTAIAICLLLFDLFRPRVKVVGAALGTLFLFVGFAQIKFLGGDTGSTASLNLSPTDYLLRVDFDAFKQLVDTVIYLDLGGEGRGLDSFVGMLLFWVPRSIWPEKPIPAGEEVSSFLGYSYTNVSSPLPAEALLAFGNFGPLAVGLALGFVVSRVEGRVRSASVRADQTFIVYALLAGFITIILRGALNGVAPMFLSAFFAYAIVLLFGRVGRALASTAGSRRVRSRAAYSLSGTR